MAPAGGDPVFAPDITLVFFKGTPQEARLGVHSFMLCGCCPGLEHALIQQQLQATGLNSSTAAAGAGGPQAAQAGQQQATELSLDTDPQATYGVLCWLYSGVWVCEGAGRWVHWHAMHVAQASYHTGLRFRKLPGTDPGEQC